MTRRRNHVRDLRGASHLAIEATTGITDLVEAMHLTVGSGPAVLGRPFAVPTRLLTWPVYRGIRAVTELVGAGIDGALAQLEPLVGDRAARPEHEAVLAAVNGVLGDFLDETGNPLAIEMQLRRGGQRLALDPVALRQQLPDAGSKLLVLVHGSSLNDLAWTRRGHDHGAALARDLGFTPVYLLYNSGLHVSTNGRAFADLLEQLVGAWPAPVHELTLLGHSMGGLVSRSACHAGERAGHRWRRLLKALVCLGTPHHGSPLERGGNWVDTLLAATPYSAPFARLGKIRSAGVTDLRFGSVLDQDWDGHDRFAGGPDPREPLPLPDGVACFTLAGTTSTGPGGSLRSDGLVPVDSALGRGGDRTLLFPESHQWIAYGAGHLDLLDQPAVYATLAGWLGALSPPGAG
ncbi:MAG: alpha/beta hydrolase [Myxococcota bacterium]